MTSKDSAHARRWTGFRARHPLPLVIFLAPMLEPTIIAQGALARMRELHELLTDEGIASTVVRPPGRGGG